MAAVDFSSMKQLGDGTVREKDVKRTASFHSLFRRSPKTEKSDTRSSESTGTSKEHLSSESEGDAANKRVGSSAFQHQEAQENLSSVSSPISSQTSLSCPTDLPLPQILTPQQQQQHSSPGLDTSSSVLSSPAEKSSQLGKSLGVAHKDRKSPKHRKKPKRSPWYNVLTASYKTKLEEFRKYFKDIHTGEKLIGDYSCALQKDILVQGRMYVTENWLCFYANIFKWETLLTVKLKDITAITKERTIRLIPNAVQVATESEKYFFASFLSRERTYHLLFRVWQNALLDQKMLPAEYWNRIHNNYGNNLGLSPDELPDDYVHPNHSPNNTEPGDFEGNKSPGEHVTEGDDMDKDEESFETLDVDEDKSSKVTGSHIVGQPKVMTATKGAEDEPLDEEGEVYPLDLEPLHHNAKEYMNSYFNVTVDRFFAAMYKKENPFYRNFLLHRKHTDIVIGDWQQNDRGDIREVSYTFHLNNPVGPKSCVVEEKQIVNKKWSRPGHSYVISIEAFQKGPPYADYFWTEARMVITRVSSASCHVRVCAHTVYKKSPWGPIKNFIEKNAEYGMKTKHAELDTYIKQHLESRVPRNGVGSKRVKKRKHLAVPSKDKEEEEEDEPRPIKRMESVPQCDVRTNSPATHFLPWLRADSRTLLLLVCIFLIFLSIVNISLFLQLQSIEQLAGKTDSEWSPGKFTDKFKDIPQSKEEWSTLLQKQLYFHETEMERWRDALGLCIELMKKMETTLCDLHASIKSDKIPDSDAGMDPTKEPSK